MKKTDKIARKGIALCEEVNICVFPFLVVNEVVVDQTELFTMLDSTDTSA
jgi:hypothetical protein